MSSDPVSVPSQGPIQEQSEYFQSPLNEFPSSDMTNKKAPASLGAEKDGDLDQVPLKLRPFIVPFSLPLLVVYVPVAEVSDTAISMVPQSVFHVPAQLRLTGWGEG